MKYLVKEGVVTIRLDSRVDSEVIKDILRMICCTISGVESSGQWELFTREFNKVNTKLLNNLRKQQTQR